MAIRHQITINGTSIAARRGDLLLDAALSNGIDIPYDCRAGHCGTCCVRLVSGEVRGGQGSEPGIVHACQCRISGDAVIESQEPVEVRSVEGVLGSLLPLSRNVVEVGIKTARPMPYHAGQYVKLRFDGYPARPFSVTHILRGRPDSRSIWFHIRRVEHGRVTASLGTSIKPGHRVQLTGPFGSAHFRPGQNGRLLLIGTNTGFAPLYAIAVAALRENPSRIMMIIAGGRTLDALYMGPALARLTKFPKVRVVCVCSAPHTNIQSVLRGRPTDYLPHLLPTDIIYACGAPAMVDQVKSIAASVGAVCYADPFLPSTDDTVAPSMLTRAKEWLSVPIIRPPARDRSQGRGEQSPRASDG